MLNETIYLKMRHRIEVRPNESVKVGDLAQIITTNKQLKKQLEEKVVHHINMADKSIVIIGLMSVIRLIKTIKEDIDVQTIGASQTIVSIQYEKKALSPVLFVFVWLLLFIGSGLAIMNFHEDVSMQEVHQKIYYLVTGEKQMKPLLLQIPYSVGLGIGMILFFNHIFKKRFNEEPSPLEVEMFNYQQDLDRYMVMNEEQEKGKKFDDS